MGGTRQGLTIHGMQVGIFSGKRLDNVSCPIGGMIVHGDHFKMRVILIQQRGQAGTDTTRLVARRHTDGDEGGIWHVYHGKKRGVRTDRRP